MASTKKNVNVRVQLKHDTEANWNKATSFIPMAGEVIIYDPDTTITYPRTKIGDGVRTVPNLPFIDYISMAEVDEICNQSITAVSAYDEIW